MMSAVADFSERRLFMLQCPIDAAGTDSNDACNLFFVLTRAKQLPDFFMVTNTVRMTTLTVLVVVLLGDGLGNRTHLSCKLVCCRFK